MNYSVLVISQLLELLQSLIENLIKLSGTACSWSSAIYFNGNIYCFGGSDYECRDLTLSERFNLEQNRWIKLCSMPENDTYCHCLVFNENILIARKLSWRIRLYSIATDFFSIIPYNFEYFAVKILINVGRLYLIESGKGKVYESEFRNENVWMPIGKSTINYHPNQICCSYNKGDIYIGCSSKPNYFKFNLISKVTTKL